MQKRGSLPLAVVPTALALVLAGCATPRLHSPLELADAALLCGVPARDLVQERDLRRILFFYTVAPTTKQLDCVHAWARRNHLHLAFIEAVERPTQQAEP
jgi:hypothetical protein